MSQKMASVQLSHPSMGSVKAMPAMTALALLGFAVVPNYICLLLLAIPLGLGAGAVDAGINNYVAQHCEPRHMNWLHCFWGLGATVGPYVMAACLARLYFRLRSAIISSALEVAESIAVRRAACSAQRDSHRAP